VTSRSSRAGLCHIEYLSSVEVPWEVVETASPPRRGGLFAKPGVPSRARASLSLPGEPGPKSKNGDR
jgi:hypothetical protein